MHVCTVVGNVWATQKDATLEGLRLLVVQPILADGALSAETMVAVDTIGAGIGERVLVVHGRAARFLTGRAPDVGFQTAVAGIVDRMELPGGLSIGTVAELDRGPGSKEPGTTITGGAQRPRTTRKK
jgi:ethanolamine utilization protein EutN